MMAMAKCNLCFNEFEEDSVSCYPSNWSELCWKYFHSSLTQETLLPQSDQGVSFCPKCFESVMELGDLRDQLEFHQKRISEFVFILSLEILHRRGDSSNDQNRENKSLGRKLIEFDVSALPNCDFKKNTIVNSKEIETPTKEYDNFSSGDINNANTFEKIKIHTDNHSLIGNGIHDEISATEDINIDFSIEKADQSFSIGQTGSKRLIPTLKLQSTDINCIPDSSYYNKQISEKKEDTADNLSQSKELEIQAAVHSEKSQYNCDVCGKICKTKGCMLKHKMIHTGERPHKSANSKKRSTSFQERPFKCEVCGKGFSCQSILLTHRRIHTGERPYKCEVCGKIFTQKNHLVAHSTTHAGERPYKCEVCGKRFTQNCNLTVHKKIHAGERPYNCAVCSKTFTQKCHLVEHSKTHSRERPYKCDVCGKTFTQKHNLTVHSKIHIYVPIERNDLT